MNIDMPASVGAPQLTHNYFSLLILKFVAKQHHKKNVGKNINILNDIIFKMQTMDELDSFSIRSFKQTGLQHTTCELLQTQIPVHSKSSQCFATSQHHTQHTHLDE